VNDMAEVLKVSPNTVKQRLFQNGIKPISSALLYEKTALEKIKDTTMGRPKKTALETKPVKPKTKKTAKGKK